MLKRMPRIGTLFDSVAQNWPFGNYLLQIQSTANAKREPF